MRNLLGTLRCLLMVSLLAGASLMRAASTDYGMAGGSIMLPEGLKSSEVQKYIVESAIGRGWNIVSRDGEKVVIRLDQEKWSSTLTLVYTTTDVQIFSNSTRSGKPKLPANWIRFLKEDITKKANLHQLTKELNG